MQHPSSIDIESLKQSLKEQGVSYVPLKREIIKYASSDKDSNLRIFEKTNHILLNMLSERTDLGKTIHITSVLRALTDSYHRFICMYNYQRHNKPLSFLCYFPPDKTLSSVNLIEWFMRYWGPDKSLDALEAFYLISTEQVKLFFTTEEPAYQYSVFPRGYVLYQAKHKIQDQFKKRWILKSDNLNKNLYDKALPSLNNATPISANFFKDCLRIVTSGKAFNFLENLRNKDRVERKYYSRYPKVLLQYLILVNLIEKDHENCLLFTDQGKEFLERRRAWLEMGEELMPRMDLDEVSGKLIDRELINNIKQISGYIDRKQSLDFNKRISKDFFSATFELTLKMLTTYPDNVAMKKKLEELLKQTNTNKPVEERIYEGTVRSVYRTTALVSLVDEDGEDLEEVFPLDAFKNYHPKEGDDVHFHAIRLENGKYEGYFLKAKQSKHIPLSKYDPEDIKRFEKRFGPL